MTTDTRTPAEIAYDAAALSTRTPAARGPMTNTEFIEWSQAQPAQTPEERQILEGIIAIFDQRRAIDVDRAMVLIDAQCDVAEFLCTNGDEAEMIVIEALEKVIAERRRLADA